MTARIIHISSRKEWLQPAEAPRLEPTVYHSTSLRPITSELPPVELYADEQRKRENVERTRARYEAAQRESFAERLGDVLCDPRFVSGVIAGAWGTILVAFIMVAMGLAR